MVLKGVRGGFNETEVLEELKSLNLKDVAIMKVSKMVFNRNTPERYHFIITTTTESNMPSLTGIKFLLNQRIRWERLRKKPIFQCTKCQRTGHASSNCFFEPRCVRCAKPHSASDCPLDKEKHEELRCANCGESGHPASYYGCPMLKAFLNKKKELNKRRQMLNEAKFTKINKFVQKTIIRIIVQKKTSDVKFVRSSRDTKQRS